jgi:hypothetical protein
MPDRDHHDHHEHREPRPGLTDDEARVIAARMVHEAGRAPDADRAGEDNATALDEPRGGQSARDEDRIEAALVDLGVVPPETTSMAERDSSDVVRAKGEG